MNDSWIDAGFEWPPIYDPGFVEKVKDALRGDFPYIDEATPQEVMELASKVWFS